MTNRQRLERYLASGRHLTKAQHRRMRQKNNRSVARMRAAAARGEYVAPWWTVTTLPAPEAPHDNTERTAP